MPIGDPMGGEMYDLGRGRLTRLWMVSVPVKDLDEAMEYYRDVLGLEIATDLREKNRVEMGWKDGPDRIVLYVPGADDKIRPGMETGIVIATDSVFEVHRRLVDEGVNFVLKPTRQPWGGLMAVFEDLCGNRLTVMDDTSGQGPQNDGPASSEKEGRSGVMTSMNITK